ncbi:MAG: ribosomal RNA small subunit methyltransferase A [Syntrophomonadaceae bacterium]|nr:ribosomal RNA small subunit methyltransferase A [Syntrophomonadaceae bacterium]
MRDRASPSGVRDLLRTYEVFPKKKLGQNFLVDRNILAKIADSCDINDQDYLLEIGPGLGVLTQELAQRAYGVLAVELDYRLKPVLTCLAGETDNIKLIFNDILKLDIEAEMDRAFQGQGFDAYKVCANIPYNITTPIIFKLLENCPRMTSATLMMQKEVGERLVAAPGGKNYGRLTVMADYYAHPELIMHISRNCYYPRPEVDSVVIKLTRRSQPIARVCSESAFRDFVAASFQKRRKTILNIASEFFGTNKADTQMRIEAIGLKSNLRPENLSSQEIIMLVNRFTT